MRRWRRRLRRLLGLAAAALLLWLGGLAWFVYESVLPGGDRAVTTDAIVVLTGGRLRLETGLDLLAADKAQKLFISGVNPRVDQGDLRRVVGSLRDFDTGRVILGHTADNTLGNARETAAWMRQQGYRSLRLVTSWYHMRRSLLEFERTMPDMLILAEPVFATHLEPGVAGWVDVALLTIGEYDKYLLTLMWPGVSEFWPGMPGSRPASAVTDRLATV